MSIKLIFSIILFCITTILGIFLLSNPFGSGLDLMYQTPVLVNGVVWIISIISVIIQSKKYSKKSKQEKQEISDLKDRIKELEKNKDESE